MAVLDRTLEKTEEVAARLTSVARRTHRSAFDRLSWPESLPDDAFWVDPSLLSVAGTEVEEELSDEQLRALSRAECRNFFSLNIHGIRGLIATVVGLVHQKQWRPPVSDFLHHFVGEENEHMWFFAEFCYRYLDGVSPELRLGEQDGWEGPAAELLAFVRILVFEEIVDYWNKRNAQSELLHPFVREINRVHREDEGRHVAFGETIVRELGRTVTASLDAEERGRLEDAVRRYLTLVFLDFLDVRMYRDARLPEPLRLRRRIASDPVHRERFTERAGKCLSVLRESGILGDRPLEFGGT